MRRCRTILLSSFLLASCGTEKGTGPVDQVWRGEYIVENRTPLALLVTAHGRWVSPSGTTDTIPTQSEAVIVSYAWFLGVPSKPSRDLSCVTVHELGADVLIYQQAPIQDGKWRNESSPGKTRFRLVLHADSLRLSGVEDTCKLE